MEAISVKVDYVPRNMTQFMDDFEMLLAREQEVEPEDLSTPLVDPSAMVSAAAVPQPAPVYRRRLRQLASDITDPVATVPFTDAYATSYQYQAAPLGPTAAPAAVAELLPGTALNSTDIFMMPMAFTSWASANVTESPCKMHINGELPEDFLTVRREAWHAG